MSTGQELQDHDGPSGLDGRTQQQTGESGPSPWPARLLEMMIIVSSILLAFGIEAWWDERQEREAEQEILAGLEREFIDYRDKLTNAIEKHGAMKQAMAALLEAIESGSWNQPELTLDEAVMRSLWPPTTEFGGGVRDALIQAGRLELISDRRLREKLALWPGVYAEVLDDEVFSRDLVFDALLPHLAAEGYDLSAALDGLTDYSSVHDAIGADADEVRRLLTDRSFRTLLQTRLGFWLHAREEYDSGLLAVEEILALIQAARSE